MIGNFLRVSRPSRAAASVVLVPGAIAIACSSGPANESTATVQQALSSQVRMTATALTRDDITPGDVEAKIRWYGFTPPPGSSDGWTPLATCQQSGTCQLASPSGVGPFTRTIDDDVVVIDGKLLVSILQPMAPNYAFCFAVSLNRTTGALSPAPTTPGVCVKDTGGLTPDPALDIHCGAAASPPLPANTCRFDAYVSNRLGVPWSVTFNAANLCVPTGISEADCNGDDDDCDGQVDEDFLITTLACGNGACRVNGSLECRNGSVDLQCPPGPTPTPEVRDGIDNDCDGQVDECDPAQAEVYDGVDNDCDGQIDECNPGQTDFWCCSQTGQSQLTFNVVPTSDENPPPACVPTSVNPSGTCSLRGVFDVADRSAANGCVVNANVAAGVYPLTAELPLTRGNLRLSGQGAANTSIEGAVPAGKCAIKCVESCSAVCHAGPIPEDAYECAPSCDANCNRERDPQCVQACRAFVNHRLVNVVAAPGASPRIELRNLALRGGRNPRPGGVADNAGGGMHMAGGTLLAERILVENNWARGWGVGLAAYSSNVTIFDSVFRNNVNDQVGFGCQTDQTSGAGGGVTARGGGLAVVDSTTLIERSTISGNVSSDGGGVAALRSGNLVIRNSTITGNSSPGRAGGLLTQVDTTLEFNTITLNSAGFNTGPENERGGGFATDVVVGAGARTLRAYGNVVGRNTTRSVLQNSHDCSIQSTSPGWVLERGYNLVMDPDGDCAAFPSPLDITGQGPSLAPSTIFSPDRLPADSGTLLHTLESGGPGIDFYPLPTALAAGAPPCPLYDQRGFLRDPTACDIGAVESSGVADSDRDGIADEVDAQPLASSSAFSDVARFGNTTGNIVNRNGHTVLVTDTKTGVRVSVLGPGSPVQISACGTTTTIPANGSAVISCPRPTSCVFASQTLTMRDRADIVTRFYSAGFTIGSDATVLGRGLARGNGFLGLRSVMSGGARLTGTLSGNRAGVLNGLVERTTVPVQTLAQRTVVAGTTAVEVLEDQTRVLEPGDYGTLIVRWHGTLILAKPGIYRFSSILVEPDARLEVPGGAIRTVIAASGNVTLGDRLVVARRGGGSLTREDTLFYSNGATVDVGFDIPLLAEIEAPVGAIQFRDRSTLAGCLGARNVTLGFDTVVGDNLP